MTEHLRRQMPDAPTSMSAVSVWEACAETLCSAFFVAIDGILGSWPQRKLLPHYIDRELLPSLVSSVWVDRRAKKRCENTWRETRVPWVWTHAERAKSLALIDKFHSKEALQDRQLEWCSTTSGGVALGVMLTALPRRAASARRVALCSAHRIAVLTGAAVSPAYYRGMAQSPFPCHFTGNRLPTLPPCLPTVHLWRCTRPGTQHWYIGTLDLAKAFDYALRVGSCSTLAWTRPVPIYSGQSGHNKKGFSSSKGNQARSLQSKSLPQATPGQCWLWQWFSCHQHMTSIPRFPAIAQVIYADDRTLAAPDAPTLMSAVNAWEAWTETLGLQENRSKAQFYHPTQAGRTILQQNGVSPDKTTESIRVLGYSFAGVKARKADAREFERLQQATVKMMAGWLFRFPSLENVKPLNAAMRMLERCYGSPSNLIHLCTAFSVAIDGILGSCTNCCNATSILDQWRGPFLQWRARSGWTGAQEKA